MNWFVFEDAPTWFWLHALKPVGHSEAAGYALGYWQPINDTTKGDARDKSVSAEHLHQPSWASAWKAPMKGQPGPVQALPPGNWEFIDENWNAIAGFTKYMPWNSVRVRVSEDVVRHDARILAYLYSTAAARWLPGRCSSPCRGTEREGGGGGLVRLRTTVMADEPVNQSWTLKVEMEWCC